MYRDGVNALGQQERVAMRSRSLDAGTRRFFSPAICN
jgi:hypothetical protein